MRRRGGFVGADLKAARQTRSDELAVMSKVDLVLTYTAVEEAVALSKIRSCTVPDWKIHSHLFTVI